MQVTHDFYKHSSCWDGRQLGHNIHGPKSGMLWPPFWGGELGPHVTQCGLGWGLPPYQVASWTIQPFGHNRRGPKIGEGQCPLFSWGRELGPHLTHCGQGWGLPLCRGILTHPTTWPQYTNVTERQDRAGQGMQTDRQRSDSIGRTVLQMVAQKQQHLF